MWFWRKKMMEHHLVTDNDMLAMSLSSINPGKGQLLVLNSSLLVIEQESQPDNSKIKSSLHKARVLSALPRKHHIRSLFQELFNFLSQHSNLSKSVLWTPATTRVAALYSAAHVYVMNSQVLGTESGGTQEIVDHNVTGLLHPLGHPPGTQVVAKNLRLLLKNSDLWKQMGLKGREKVESMYLKRHMYKKFVDVFLKCMRPK